MSRLKMLFLALLVLIVLLVVGLLAFVYLGVIRPALPQVDGELSLPGLHATVTVYRDAAGIPHIVAADAHDVFFIQGFVHAQDRLWAMESGRRAAHGTLSEVIGERGLKNDTLMRILGLTEAAEADWQSLDAETQAALQAYADGVNAFLSQAGRGLPLELRLLGLSPQPWTPVDSLALGKLVSWSLSNNYQDELIIAKLAAALPWTDVLTLLPEYPGPDVIPAAEESAALESSVAALLDFGRDWQAVVPLARPDQGSNAWVVGGSHTASGKPLLAGDPHQALTMPNLWYEVGLHSEDGLYDVVGASIPGLPGIEIGHNAHIAWAVTNARPDVQDLFIETLSADGTQYLFQGEWKPLSMRQEVIAVKGGDPITLTVRATHHGPLVTDATPEAEQAMALRWTGIDRGRPLAQAIVQLNRARNWDEFRAAVALWELPGMNFVYADTEGNIGYQMSGAVPIRANNDVFGLRPVDGADGAHEWVGFVPFAELPSALNPKGDFFASANNRPAGKDYPHFLSHYYQPPYRVALIGETVRRLRGGTVADFAALQLDRSSAINRQVAQALVAAAAPQNEAEKTALTLLTTWDGVMSPDSQAAALSEAALRHLIRQALIPRLDAATVASYLNLMGYPYMFVQALLDDPNHAWWHGRREAILSAALSAAVAELGSDPKGWTWGAIHAYTASHPLGSIGPLRPIFNRGPYPAGGNWNTVNSGGYYPDRPYAMALGPAYRIIADPADWDASVSIMPGGQSGHPFSPHYADQIEPWLRGEYHPLPFSRQAITAAARHTLHLKP